MTPLPVETLELRPRRSLSMQQQNKKSYWTGLLLMGVLPFVYLTTLFTKERSGQAVDWEALWMALWKKIEADPLEYALQLLMLCVAVLYLAYFYAAQKRERLVLTCSGVTYHSPLPAGLQFLRRSWSVSWSQVRALSLQPASVSNSLLGVMLVLETSASKHKLAPYYWVMAQSAQSATAEKPVSPLRRFSAAEQAAEIDASPLMHYVQAALPTQPVKRAVALFQPPFAIEKNPSALGVTSVFLFLLLYAILDGGFLLRATYADAPPYAYFATFGAVAAIAGWLWMWRRAVPLVEGLVIALFTGGAAALAAYPGALRLNALTDVQGPKSYVYIMAATRVFTPPEQGLPVLHFDGNYEYWSQVRTGSDYVFELRRGGLGFFQLNLEPIEQDMRNFYTKSR